MAVGTMMHIGELAEKTGLSLRTLRHYDEVGLLRASSRSEGGFRLYSSEDLERLVIIRRLKPLNISLDELSVFLDAWAQVRASSALPAGVAACRTFLEQARVQERALREQLAVAGGALTALEAELSAT